MGHTGPRQRCLAWPSDAAGDTENRVLELAVIAIVVYAIAFYVFDLPDWLRLVAAILSGGAWIYLYAVYPAR